MVNDLRSASLAIGIRALRWLAVRHPGWVSELTNAVRPGSSDQPDDAAFLEQVYQQLLGRSVDPEGRASYLAGMANGLDRAEVVLSVASSDEHRFHCDRLFRTGSGTGPRVRSPDRYRFTPELSLWTFEARSPEDFDWLEAAILEDGYYEHPGVWGLEVDTDKRVMAEIVGSLARGRVLELGCANGTVLEGLFELGVSFEGIDISAMAIERASERVRNHIHHGDLLSLRIGNDFDTIFGLDVFEHLNPNRLGAYVERLRTCLLPGGVLFANIPAFGSDEVFGEVFPYYIRGWDDDAAAGRCFQTLHVDDDGYPMNGHLIWADTRWWVGQFQAAGFRRQTDIEAALHQKYDHYLRVQSPARRSFYVFSTGNCRSGELTRRILDSTSPVLTGWRP